MHDANFREFKARVNRIQRAQAKLSDGFTLAVDPDGLIQRRPIRKRVLRVPVRGILLVAAVLTLFKAATVVQVGPQAYEARLEALRTGSAAEAAGAFLMQADPVTLWLSEQLAPMAAMLLSTGSGQ